MSGAWCSIRSAAAALLCEGRRGAVGLAFAAYGAHDARANMRSTSEKRFEDTIGRQQS